MALFASSRALLWKGWPNVRVYPVHIECCTPSKKTIDPRYRTGYRYKILHLEKVIQKNNSSFIWVIKIGVGREEGGGGSLRVTCIPRSRPTSKIIAKRCLHWPAIFFLIEASCTACHHVKSSPSDSPMNSLSLYAYITNLVLTSCSI